MQAPPSGLPPSSPSQPAEAGALRKFTWFAIVQLVGTAGGWVASFYFFGLGFWLGFGSSLGPNPTNAQIAAVLDPLFRNISYLVVFGLVLGLAALLLLISAMRDLAKVDRRRFEVPSILLLLSIIGLVLVVVGVYPLLSNIASLIRQAPGTNGVPSQASFSALGFFFVYIALVGVGGILAIVGLIGGQILGLWRVGAKYDQTVIKVGAIFFVLPLLNVIAPVLVLVGAWEAKNHLAVPGSVATSAPST